MVERVGIGLAEQAIVETMAELGLGPDESFLKTARVLSAVQERTGLDRRRGLDALSDLAAAWLLPVPFVEGHGNFGSPDDAPANPKYTEARLTRAGWLAGSSGGPRLPLGLINGDVHVDGRRPSFSPAKVLDAVERAASDPDASDEELVELVGAPVSVTGSVVTGDVAALVAGAPVVLHYAAVIEIEGPDRLVASGLPPRASTRDAISMIHGRSRRAMERTWARFPDADHLRRRSVIPLLDADDESAGSWPARIVISLEPGADPAAARAVVLELWGLAREVPAQLPAPLADLVRAEVDDDRDAQLAAFSALR